MTENKTEWQGSKSLKSTLTSVASLTEDPNNARGHDEASITAIEVSLKRFGQLKPIVVRNGIVIAGNGTLRAARKLGWVNIAAITVDHLDENEAKAYAIVCNRTSELSHWNFAVLETQLHDLQCLKDDDLLSSLGWSDKDLKAIMEKDTIEVSTHTREITQSDLKTDTKCPKCGFEFKHAK